MITVSYNNQILELDSNKIELLQNFSSFERNTKIIELKEQRTLDELKFISENLFNLQTKLEYDELSDYYLIKSLYDPEYVEIYRRDSDELYPEFEFLFSYSSFFGDKIYNKLEYNFGKLHESIELFSDFFENMVIAGPYIMNFLFFIETNTVDFYIHCDNLNEFLKKIRKHISHFMSFEEDENKITILDNVFIHKKNFNSRSEIAKQFTVDCEQCILDLKEKIIYKTEICIYSHKYKVNTLNFQNLSQLYYYKLGSYCSQGFNLTFPSKEKDINVYPKDLKNTCGIIRDISHKGVYLLIFNIYNYEIFRTSELSNEVFIFSNNEDFFKINENNEIQDYIPLEDILQQDDLKYWYKKEEISFPELFIEQDIKSDLVDSAVILNCILGYEIKRNGTIEIFCKKMELLIIDIIKNHLIKIGIDKDKLEEFSSCYFNHQNYIKDLLIYLEKDINTEYMKEALLLIYDYDDFNKNINCDQLTNEKINELKNIYNLNNKIKNIHKNIYSLLVYDEYFSKFKFVRPQIIPYRLQTLKGQKLTHNNQFYKIESGKIFIKSGFFNIELNFKQIRKNDNSTYHDLYVIYTKIFYSIKNNIDISWANIKPFLRSNIVKNVLDFHKIINMQNVNFIIQNKNCEYTLDCVCSLFVKQKYKIDNIIYKNKQVFCSNCVPLIDMIFSRLEIGFDVKLMNYDYKITSKPKINFPYIVVNQNKGYELSMFQNDEIFFLLNNNFITNDKKKNINHDNGKIHHELMLISLFSDFFPEDVLPDGDY